MRFRISLLLAVLVVGYITDAYAFRRRKSDSELVSAQLQEAKILMADENYDGAIAMLKKIVDEYPDNPKTEIALATINHCYQIIGYMNEAFDYYLEVEKKHPESSIAIVAIYHYIPILIKRERYEEAVEKCQEVYDYDNESYWAIGSLFNMANLYCDKLDQEEKGIELYNKIIKKYPNSQFSKIARMELAMRGNK